MKSPVRVRDRPCEVSPAARGDVRHAGAAGSAGFQEQQETGGWGTRIRFFATQRLRHTDGWRLGRSAVPVAP